MEKHFYIVIFSCLFSSITQAEPQWLTNEELEEIVTDPLPALETKSVSAKGYLDNNETETINNVMPIINLPRQRTLYDGKSITSSGLPGDNRTSYTIK